MSELRQNLLTGNWTVLAPERAARPASGSSAPAPAANPLPEYEPSCPFCPHNEERFPLEIIDEIRDGNSGWITRTINNKYKLFDDFPYCPVNPEPFKRHDIYSCYAGCGHHLLVIESRTHHKLMGQMDAEEIYNTFLSYRKICQSFKENPNNLITIIFKNQGARAGASQAHAHSQIVGSRIVPAGIRSAMHVQDKYFDDFGACALCTILGYELKAKERIVLETKDTVALSPYAASAPYEIWIVPKRHLACYEDIKEYEIGDLAEVLKKVLGAYINKLNNPDFNYFLHSAPHPMSPVPFYHIYLQILPRMTTPGGFEAGTNIPVNTVLPETLPQLLALDS